VVADGVEARVAPVEADRAAGRIDTGRARLASAGLSVRDRCEPVAGRVHYPDAGPGQPEMTTDSAS
jgi:hypothetical protein